MAIIIITIIGIVTSSIVDIIIIFIGLIWSGSTTGKHRERLLQYSYRSISGL